MSLQLAAQHLESKGRGRDKKLLHVSPRELQGLQAIAKAKGGSLTINPETGLPEAGFLEDILPMLAMGAATYFTAGAAAPMLMNAGLGATSAGILSGAGAGALIGGAGAALTGGDVGKSALTGGIGGALSGALGAYGGPESAPGFGVSPNAAPGVTLTPDVNAGVGLNPNAGLSQANQFTQALKVNPQSGLAIDPLSGFAPPSSPVSPSSYITPNTPVQATTYGARDTAGSILNAPKPSYALTPPAPAAPATPDAANKGFFGNMSTAGKVGTVLGGTALVSALGNQDVPTFTEEESRLRRISPNFRAQGPVQPNPYYSPVYAAGGGGIRDILLAQGGTYEDEPMGDDSGMARGGIADLGSYSDGGRMLKGPGDGMSDDIPAVIGRKQPARLADGEFVVPADVVSHLGNGSTDAGAKKLYAMMDKVRQARTGRKKQAPAVKTQKYMPKFAEGGDVSATAQTAAVPGAYLGSGMSLADIASLGNFISRGNAAPMQQQAPTQSFIDTDLATKLAAANANRPTVNLSARPSYLNYDNIRPDMLIDPSKAGWNIAGSGNEGPFGGLMSAMFRKAGTMSKQAGMQNSGNLYIGADGTMYTRSRT